uniref:Putative LOC101862095 [Aplysia californica] n=1 Tax=Lepeophtheirus salmonis TaxID=72036 RepID=A0A0K2VFJ5_LEPSM
MQDYSNSMNSLSEVQRIIGLSLSKIQIGRNQRGGLPLHKNLLVATVLNKARDLYMQETMYMNYKMMTGQLNAAQMSCMAMHVPSAPSPLNHPNGMPASSDNSGGRLSQPPPPQQNLHPASSSMEPTERTGNAGMSSPYEEEASCSSSSNKSLSAQEPSLSGPLSHNNSLLTPPSSRAHPSPSDEGFIDEPDCDCDARNFSSESTRVPFQYCYQCAPFHPSNGRGPTLVPAAKPSIRHHHQSEEESLSGDGMVERLVNGAGECSSGSSHPVASNQQHHSNTNFTIYDMDSKATELRTTSTSNSSSSTTLSHSGLRKRRISDSNESLSRSLSGKRSRSNSGGGDESPDEYSSNNNCSSTVGSQFQLQTHSPQSGSSDSSSDEEVFHPAFRNGNHHAPSPASLTNGLAHQFHHPHSSSPQQHNLHHHIHHQAAAAAAASHHHFQSSSSSLLSSTLSSSAPSGSSSSVSISASQQSPTNNHSSSCNNPPPSMEIDQITSLVSIFSFGQQIMAAAAAASEASKRLQSHNNKSYSELEEDNENQEGEHHEEEATEERIRGEVSTSPKDPTEEEDNNTDHIHCASRSCEDEKSSSKHNNSKKEEADSDSESDTSSDSGHSSDDLEAASSPEESSSLSAANNNSPGSELSSKTSPPPTTNPGGCSAQEVSSVGKKDSTNCILPVATV